MTPNANPQHDESQGNVAFIDGAPVEIRPDDTILAAARRAGVLIPTLCEFAALAHRPGTCRACLVEVEREEGVREIVTSCDTRILPGMRVHTRSAEVRRQRRRQVELLMADHHENCSGCARHGRCELQDVALLTGVKSVTGESLSGKLLEGRPPRKVDATAAALRYDGGKCIRCLRCIEVCRRVQGSKVAALTLESTGTDARIGFRGADSWGASDVCIQCGQCSLVCPTGAISVVDECDKVLDLIDDEKLVTVFQIAPAVRVALGEEFGLPPGANVEGRIVTALKRIGADYVMDTLWSADVTIMEEGMEMLAHFEEARRAGTLDRPFTYFTSCCPGWINYVEKMAPDMIPHVSTTRSPQAIFAALAKTWMPESAGIDPKSVRVISVMPCTAKKDEAARPLLAREGGRRDTDVVLTVREFARLIRRTGLNLADLPPSPFDTPRMTLSSGGAMLFASTGGVMEAALRTMSAVKNGGAEPLPAFEPVRGGAAIKEATVRLGDLGEIRVAVVHECANAAKVIEMVRKGVCPYHFVEVMACPRGCVGGGGTPRGRNVWGERLDARQNEVYAIDRDRPIRASHENPEVKRVYEEYLGAPGSHLAHELLHCSYAPHVSQGGRPAARRIIPLVSLSPECEGED